jgi:hypothetical protein
MVRMLPTAVCVVKTFQAPAAHLSGGFFDCQKKDLESFSDHSRKKTSLDPGKLQTTGNFVQATTHKPELVIVTGASSNHFHCLKNLLYTISRYERGTPTIVYDLGLAPRELEELNGNAVTIKKFQFEKYPPHLDIRVDRGQYAWKPVIVESALRETNFTAMALWLDAGNLVQKKLKRVRATLEKNGFYSPVSSGTVAQWTHPGTLAYLRAPEALRKRPNRNGAIVGFNPAQAGIIEMVECWKECALDPRCIAPAGSNRSNHRQDQSVLSVLAYQFQERFGYQLINGFLDIAVHQDRVSLAQVRRQAMLRTWFGSWVGRILAGN